MAKIRQCPTTFHLFMVSPRKEIIIYGWWIWPILGVVLQEKSWLALTWGKQTSLTINDIHIWSEQVLQKWSFILGAWFWLWRFSMARLWRQEKFHNFICKVCRKQKRSCCLSFQFYPQHSIWLQGRLTIKKWLRGMSLLWQTWIWG